MKIKNLVFLIIFLLSATHIFAQADIENLVKEGIELHENGNYEAAIETYKKALEIDPKSTLVNYEIALSYFTKGDYEEAVTYSDVVLEQDEDFTLQAYLTKGSALDMLGRTPESIKLFEKAINETGGHYLLYYNLGLNYYKMNDFDDARENVIQAIEFNPNHSSSHLMLAKIHYKKGNPVQSLLATYYFLFLEPDSQRSPVAHAMLQENFGGNVSKDENKPNTINITYSPSDDSQFGAAELMISMLVASNSLEKNEGKTDDELFVENTESLFKILGEQQKKESKEIWWTFYTPFFYDLARSEHLETFCKYITQGSNENSRNWLVENESQLSDFAAWLEGQ